MRRHILFVNDQPELLRGTRRMLFSMDGEWDIDFATSGARALEKLGKGPCDVIISDMKMPGTGGASLLSEVAQKHPAVIRMIFSGNPEHGMVLEVAENAHQVLAKPINGAHLIDVLKRALALQGLLNDERLSEIVAGINSIPSLPTAYMELMKVLQSPGSSMQEIGRVISKDIAMSAKIMQMVNSAFFGLPVDVKNPVHATNLLGVEVIKSLVMTVHVFKSFDNQGAQRFSMEKFTDHCLSVGALAKAIAIKEGQSQDIVDDAFIAGMMHDVGKLIVVTNYPDLYDKSTAYAEEHGLPYVYGEEEIIKTTHAEIGAYLLGKWGYRDNIVEAVAFHHRPGDSFGGAFSPLTAVHIADAIENEYGDPEGKAVATIHIDYLVKLDLIEKLEEWRQVCLETQHTLMQHDE